MSATLRAYALRVAGRPKALAPQEWLPELAKQAQGCLNNFMWYVYFLELGNGNIYVGSTDDLTRRLKSHQAGNVHSTKAFIPVTLKSYVAVETKNHACELEQYFKSGSGKAIALKRLIKS